MKRLLPHQSDKRFLVFAGTGTDLIFNRGIELPDFSTIPLVEDPQFHPVLKEQMQDLIDLARAQHLGCIIDTSTWTANRDRAAPLGKSPDDLVRINRTAVSMMRDLRDRGGADVLLALCLGPARDPYTTEPPLSVEDARQYHSIQIKSIHDIGVDLVHAYTFNHPTEAAGAALAAQDCALPVVISLVVETDGCLNNGQPVDDAIAEIDALSTKAAAYFMVNCAHPDHFSNTLSGNPRLQGVVVNASRCSHAELDEATELDDGDPVELGTELARLVQTYPMLRVLGGCCGTDMRHMRQIAERVKT